MLTVATRLGVTSEITFTASEYSFATKISRFTLSYATPWGAPPRGTAVTTVGAALAIGTNRNERTSRERMPRPEMALGRINLLLPAVRHNPFKNFLSIEKTLSSPLIPFGKPKVLFKTSYFPSASSNEHAHTTPLSRALNGRQSSARE